MENKDIVVITQPSLKSFIRLNRFLMTKTKRAVAFWTAPIIFFVMGLLLLLVGEIPMGMTFIVLAPMMIGLMLLMNRINAKLIMKSSRFYSEAGRLAFKLNENGVEYRTNNSSFFIKWEEVYRAYETNYSFYIMLDTIQSAIIDKEYIKEEQSKSITDLLQSKLDKKRFISKVSKSAKLSYAEQDAVMQFEDVVDNKELKDVENTYDVTVTTTLKLDDVIKFNNFHFFKGSNKLVLAFFPVLFLIISIMDYLSNDISGAVTYIILAILIVPLMMLITRIFVKRNFKSNKYLAGISNVFFGFNSEGFTQVVNQSRVNFKWDQIYRVYETKYYFYIYASRMQAFILLKSDFEEGKVEELKNIMSHNLTNKQYRIKN